MKRIQKVMVFVIFWLTCISSPIFCQTKNLVLSNGPGWYRIMAHNLLQAGGTIRLYGALGNNKITLMTMQVSLMGYGQGGSINITDNLYYNENHIDSIRSGSTDDHKVILDIHVHDILNPSTLTVTVDGVNLEMLSTPIFNPVAPTAVLIAISGRVIGIQSTIWPVYLSNKVGVGTRAIPSGYAFAVQGKGIMEELLIKQPGQWPDYVFEKGYKLPDLKETESFIKKNKHLPGMPSAAEVEVNGISLGEMNKKLLEKVEELTLQLIEFEKKIKTLEAVKSGK